MTATPLLSLRGIGKAYGPVVAVREVDLDIFAGEVVALCGDNGAGKSSLIKVISGAEEATSGTLAMRGKEVVFASPHDALSHGVATIYQDLALAPRLSIAQNVFMGSELTRPLLLPFLRVLDKKRMAQEARGFLKQLSVTVEDMDRPVERLSGGQRQAVAISRALRWKAEIIIMDEPTAALAIKEVGKVLDLIKTLKEHGVAVIIISHRMDDIFYACDRVMALFQGTNFADAPLVETNRNEVIGWIMGTKGHTAQLAHDKVH